MLRRNPGFHLRHADPLGYGLLHSPEDDRYLFLNPVATSVWQNGATPIDLNEERDRLFDDTGINGIQEYVGQVVADMRSSGVLIDTEDTRTDTVPGEISASQTDHPLLQVYFYATKKCNARCYHCYQPTISVRGADTEAEASDLTASEFLDFVDSALVLGLQHVKLTGGEPLLRGDWRELVAGLTRRGIKISMETNAHMLDESAAEFIVEHGVDVSISLDGGDASVHDKLRNLPGSFDSATGAIALLSAMNGSPKVIMSVSKINVGELEAVIRVAREHGTRLIKINPVNTLGVAKRLVAEKVLLDVGDIQRLFDQRPSLESRYGVFLYLEGPPAFGTISDIVSGHAAACPFTNLLGVLADGSLSFCGIGNSCPELVLGKISDPGFDLERFWEHSVELHAARETLRDDLAGVCGQCHLASFCKGSCRALAYGEYGSLRAPHPWCQRAYERGSFPAYYLKSRMEA